MIKDLSDLHNAAVESGKPEMFMTTLNTMLWKADLEFEKTTTSTSPKVDADGGGRFRWFSEMPKNPAPQEFLADPAAPKAFPLILYGDGGSAKSFLAMLLAMVNASPAGGTWLGSTVKGNGRSLVVDFELNEDTFNRRADKVAKGLGINRSDVSGLGYYEVGDLDTGTAFEEVYELCREHGFTLVVIDSVGLALQGDAGSHKDVIEWHKSRIAPLSARGITTMLIDHQARSYSDDDYQSKGSFGSVYKGNLSRSVFQVQPRPVEEGSDTLVVRMRHRKANFTKLMKPFDVWVTFSDDNILIERHDVEDDALLTEKTISLESRILSAIRSHDKGTITDISEWLGAKRGSVGNAVRDLKKEGRLEEVGKEGNASVYKIPGEANTTISTSPGEHADGGGHIEVGDDDEEASSPTSSPYKSDDDDEARETLPTSLVTSPESLFETLFGADGLALSTEIALDLETMPPEGWIFEVAAEYRAWRKKLKSKPKRERQRDKWTEFKGKTYKKYAVNPETAQVRLVSVATPEGLNQVIDASQVDINPLLEVLKNKTLLTHSGSFDLGVLRERYGYVHQGRVIDTQLLYLLHHYAEDGERTEETANKLTLPDPTKKKGMISLATLADKYLGISLDKSSQSEDWSVPELPPEMLRYALEDSRILLDLSKALTEALEGLRMGDVVTLESRTLPAIIDMERNGFPASVEVAKKMGKKYAAEAKAALDKLATLTPGQAAPDGREWRWTVADHVRDALRLLGANLDELPKTKTGDPSTAKGALNKITGPPEAVEWVETYLSYAALQKQENDFVNTYAGLIRDGVIRGSYTKTVATGRLSCRKPNLQQVPSRGELQTKDGMRVRSIFRAPEGQAFIVADFAQVELLLAATIAGEEEMLNIFRDGGDIHRETAAWVLGKPKSKVTKPERTLAKALNFGLIYGCSAERLLESAVNGYGVEDLTLKKAKKYRRAFFEKYPALKRWHDKVEADCNQGVEHTSTPLGRRRKLPYWKDSNVPAHTVAKNAPVQGAGADAIKLTLAKLFEDGPNCPGNPRLRCSVHDEVVLTVEEEHKDAAIAWVARHMADAEREVVGDPDSPIAVDVEARESW